MRSLASRLPHQLRTADVFFILSAMPVALLFVLAPQTFMWFWPGMGNLGRGGFLFVIFLLAFELIDFRKTSGAGPNRNRKLAIATVVAIGVSYFGAIALSKPLTDWIYQVGPAGGSGGYSVSWLMATDYMALTLYIVGLAVAFFGWRAIPKVISGIVLSTGMIIFFLLDAFFPYNQLGFLQVWANFIVAAVDFLMGWLFPIHGWGNTIIIDGKHGRWVLRVFWPSVGVESMLIFSLVMIVLAAKLSAPKKRKIIYAVVGALGTVFLNVIRISMISYYGFCCATSSTGLDAFHNTIGQFLYPVWIVAFLWIVLDVEGRLAARSSRAMMKTASASAAATDDDAGYCSPYATTHNPSGT